MNSSHVLESYISNAGYVRQLATPYYEELSVRENLILAANLRLPDSTTQRQKLNCVEQIIEEVSANRDRHCCIPSEACTHLHTRCSQNGGMGCSMQALHSFHLIPALMLIMHIVFAAHFIMKISNTVVQIPNNSILPINLITMVDTGENCAVCFTIAQ